MIGAVARAVLSAALAAAAVGGLLWVVGVSTSRAVLAAGCLGVVLLVRRPLVGSRGPVWPDPPLPGTRPGWHGAAQTARLLERAATDPVDRRSVVVPRLRLLAAARLRRLPGAALSERTTQLLTGRGRPSAAAVAAALSELADLDPDDRSDRRAAS